MKQLGIVLVFGLGVGVGCAAGTAVQTQVAEAQAPAGVQRWEYKCFHRVYPGPVEEDANAIGVEGWEMSGASQSVWCFKRPLL
jgi:hypothetical protein